MPTRSRSRKKTADEKHFPIRVRILIPGEGLGKTLDKLDAWLDKNVGRRNYGVNADTVIFGQHAMSIYLKDARAAADLVETFDLELAVGDPKVCGEGSFLMG